MSVFAQVLSLEYELLSWNFIVAKMKTFMCVCVCGAFGFIGHTCRACDSCRGGVYTPASAFADTTIIDRLDKHNVKFQVME